MKAQTKAAKQCRCYVDRRYKADKSHTAETTAAKQSRCYTDTVQRWLG